MYPVLFNYENYTIYSLGIFIVLGFIAFNICIIWFSKIKSLNIKFWNNHIISLVIATSIGARLFYVISHIHRFQNNWQEIMIPDGFSFYGGLLFFLILLYFYIKKQKEDLLSWTDIFALSFFPFLFLSAIGHFLDGSNYGTPTELPWGVIFDNILSPVEYTVPIHPTQLYEALYVLFIFIILLIIYKKTSRKGLVTFLSGFLLGISHFFLNYLLGDDTVMIGMLRFDQFIALIMIALCSSMLFSFLLKKPEL